MGTDARDDRFVVITDGQKLMHLVLMWRDEIPADWKPIAPGKDRRIACEVPVRFGDPGATESLDEQSVLVRGYASVLVNNQLRNAGFLDGLPPTARQLSAALAGGDPTKAPYGLERIDWDPSTRTCKTVWANRTVSVPNGVPTMSAATGLVYGLGQRSGTWGLEGLDFATGESKLWAPASPLPTENSFYAATTVGPDGAVWTGTFGGITTYRGPLKPAPEKACKDIAAPTLRVTSARLRKGRAVISGRASDTACGAAASAPRVEVSVAGGRWQRATRSGRGWRATVAVRGGAPRVRLRATDAQGNASAVIRRTLRR